MQNIFTSHYKEHRFVFFADSGEVSKEMRDEIKNVEQKEEKESYEIQRTRRVTTWVETMGARKQDAFHQMQIERKSDKANASNEKIDVYEKGLNEKEQSKLLGTVTSAGKEFTQAEFIQKVLDGPLMEKTKREYPKMKENELKSGYIVEYRQLDSIKFLASLQEKVIADFKHLKEGRVKNPVVDVKVGDIDVCAARKPVPFGHTAIGVMYKGEYLGDVVEGNLETKPRAGEDSYYINPSGIREYSFVRQTAVLFLELERSKSGK